MKSISRETPTGKEFLSPMGQISVSLSQLWNLYKVSTGWHCKVRMKGNLLPEKFQEVCVYE